MLLKARVMLNHRFAEGEAGTTRRRLSRVHFFDPSGTCLDLACGAE
jgi:hypothetical protein